MGHPEPSGDREALRARIAQLEGENENLRALVLQAQGNADGEHPGEQQMRLILDSATDYAIFTVDRGGLVTTWNSGAERLLGYKNDEVIGRNGRIFFTPEDQEAGAPEREMSTAISQGRAQDERWHMRKDGSRFWGSGLMLPLQAAGTPGLLKILRDDTARHRAEEMNELLIAEITHRVKNTLALVQAVVRETLRGRVGEKEIRGALDNRLSALARSHDILAQEHWTGASLNEVIKRTLLPFVPEERVRDVIMMEGEDVRLPPNLALLLGLAFHELATNAAKYGALSVPRGRVKIMWRKERAGARDDLRLSWRERDGPTVAPPKRKGFGSRLIERALAYSNGTTTLEYRPKGLRFKISVPLSADDTKA